MREPTYYLLLALLEGPLHGYGIAKQAKTLSDGKVDLAAGTLYGALDRLVDRGEVEVDGEETVNGRRRRYYCITDEGRRQLVGEVARLRSAVAAAEQAGGIEGMAVSL